MYYILFSLANRDEPPRTFSELFPIYAQAITTVCLLRPRNRVGGINEYIPPSFRGQAFLFPFSFPIYYMVSSVVSRVAITKSRNNMKCPVLKYYKLVFCP